MINLNNNKLYLSFTDMTTFFANNLAIHKNKTDQYEMFWSAMLLDSHHQSTAWLKAQMISKKLLNSLFNSLHMYLSRVMQTQPTHHTKPCANST